MDFIKQNLKKLTYVITYTHMVGRENYCNTRLGQTELTNSNNDIIGLESLVTYF